MSLPLCIFVIAHPDDECMFFLPTLLSLIASSSVRVWILCLSNGNYQGMGDIRQVELQNACTKLGVQKCICLTALQDNPNLPWPANQVARVLDEILQQQQQQQQQQHLQDGINTNTQLQLFTFDEMGVSGHSNHVDTYRGVQYWLSNNPHNNVQGWKLMSISNVFLKYIPFLWIPMILFNCFPKTNVYTTFCPWLVWRAMAAHDSQFVWFRKLSILTSVYSYQNTWSAIPILKKEKKTT